MCVQPRQIGIKRTGPGAENVGTLTAQDFADQTSAVSGSADDLPYGHAFLRQRKDGRIGLLAALEAFILQLLSVGQQSRVDPGGADRLPDLPHAFADRVEESSTGVLHQMPAVSDLNGVRKGSLCRHRVAAAAISGDYANLRLARQPSLRVAGSRSGSSAIVLRRSRSQRSVP